MSQIVPLILDSKPTSVLCHMGDFGCGDGGWTPVMKIDGSKVLFLLPLLCLNNFLIIRNQETYIHTCLLSFPKELFKDSKLLSTKTHYPERTTARIGLYYGVS